MLHVPYRGGAPAMTDVLGGQVQMIFDNIPGALAQYKPGKVKGFGVTTAALMKANKITNANLIRVGQVLVIP
jgi:tripartite-type tricarboxylate transporter receptor subunit TctC